MEWETSEARMRALAGRQHGVLTRAQARREGATRKALRHRIRAQGWEPVGDQILRLVGSPASDEQRCMAGALDAGRGAVVSRQTAAALWGLPGFERGAVHVTRPRPASSRTTPLAVVHESRFLPPRHCALREGIPVTTVARTLFDLAGCVHPGRTERAIENARRDHLVTLEQLRRVTVELLARGRKGSRLMRELLAVRGAGWIPTESGLEADFLALLVAAGIELPEGQVELGGEGWIGRVDFYYRRIRLVIEIDGHAFHSSVLDTEADERRDEALRAAGFEVMRITEEQLRERPHEVVARVRAALVGEPPVLAPEVVRDGTVPGARTGDEEKARGVPVGVR